jgi:hypothetical protein
MYRDYDLNIWQAYMEVINQVRRAKFGTACVDLKLAHINYITNKGRP